MADEKISEKTEATAVTNDDLAVIVNDPGGTPVTQKITIANLWASLKTLMGLTSADSPQFAGLNIGHASDTTLARSGAGDLTVEGNALYRAGGTDVPVTDGGTGASSASAARTNLGVGTSDAVTFGNVTVGGALILGVPITPTIAANQNNWAPAGLATCSMIVVDLSGGARTITGFDATGFTNGQTFFVKAINAGGGSLTFAHSSASSSVGNRIQCPGNTNFVAPLLGTTQFIYYNDGSSVVRFMLVGPVA